MSELQNEASLKKQKMDGDDSMLKKHDHANLDSSQNAGQSKPNDDALIDKKDIANNLVEAEEPTVVSTIVPTTTTATTTTTTTTSSNEQVQQDEEEDEEPSVTVYCDDCGKARILKPEFASRFDLSGKWTCSLACVKGCEQVDDELARIAGEMFATVLDAAGIKTRKQLAASVEEEFDAGPWGAYIASWISQARSEEAFDALIEICGENDLAMRLAEIGVNSPLELLLAEEDNLIQLLSESDLDQQEREVSSSQDRIRIWRNEARSVIESCPWMNDTSSFATE